MSTKVFKFRSWPWKQIFAEDEHKFAVSESTVEFKQMKEEFTKAFNDLADQIVKHPKKKSAEAFIGRDDFNNFAEDAKIPWVTDEEYKTFKPDKKMNMVQRERWVNSLIPGKKKCPEGDIFPTIIAAITARIVDMKKNVDEAIAERKRQKEHEKLVAKFFDNMQANKYEVAEELLKEEKNKFLINYKNPQKGGSPIVSVLAREGNLEGLKYAVEKLGVDLAVEDNFNCTALNWATEKEFEEIIAYLKSKNCPMGAGEEESTDDCDSDDFDEGALLGAR